MIPRWSQAMVRAWQYTVQAVDEDISGAEGLRMYRGGGGSIRTQDWYSLMRNAQKSIEGADAIGGFRSDALVPDMAHTTVDQSFSSKYKVTGEFFTTDPLTGKKVRKSISLQSNELRTLEDWQEGMNDSALSYGIDSDSEGVTAGRIWFSRRHT